MSENPKQFSTLELSKEAVKRGLELHKHRVYSPPSASKTDWPQFAIKSAAIIAIALADKYLEGAALISCLIYAGKAWGLFIFGFGSYAKVRETRDQSRSGK